jgi:hypothetical protein
MYDREKEQGLPTVRNLNKISPTVLEQHKNLSYLITLKNCEIRVNWIFFIFENSFYIEVSDVREKLQLELTEALITFYVSLPVSQFLSYITYHKDSQVFLVAHTYVHVKRRFHVTDPSSVQESSMRKLMVLCELVFVLYNEEFYGTSSRTMCIRQIRNVGSQFLIAMFVKSSLFWDVTRYSPLKVNKGFGWTYRLHLQDRKINQARNQREKNSGALSLSRTLGSWVRIPLKAWMFVFVYSVFVLSCVGSGLPTGWSPV